MKIKILAVNREPAEMLVCPALPAGRGRSELASPGTAFTPPQRDDTAGKQALPFCLMDGFQTGLGKMRLCGGTL